MALPGNGGLWPPGFIGKAWFFGAHRAPLQSVDEANPGFDHDFPCDGNASKTIADFPPGPGDVGYGFGDIAHYFADVTHGIGDVAHRFADVTDGIGDTAHHFDHVAHHFADIANRSADMTDGIDDVAFHFGDDSFQVRGVADGVDGISRRRDAIH